MLSFMLLLLLGVQILGLGLAAKTFSFSKEFDHSSRSINFLTQYFSLERGILFGGILILFSILTFIYLFLSYYWNLFPYLNDLIRLDLAVFAITFFIMGVQFLFTSFLLSLFYLKVK